MITDREYPLEDNIGFVELVDRMSQDTALKVVNSARISYKGKKEEFDDKDRKLTAFLAEHGHTSPFRHSYYTFSISAPMFVLRQWHKHTIGCNWREYEINGDSCTREVFELDYTFGDTGTSWNEVSGRYVKLEPKFYVPKKFRSNPSHGNKQTSNPLPEDFNHSGWSANFEGYLMYAYDVYKAALDAGICKEQARLLLPQSMYSQVYWTVSLHGILHFLKLRLHHDSQWEIQQYAKGIFSLVESDLDKLGLDI